jgi:hypothetical protein
MDFKGDKLVNNNSARLRLAYDNLTANEVDKIIGCATVIDALDDNLKKLNQNGRLCGSTMNTEMNKYYGNYNSDGSHVKEFIDAERSNVTPYVDGNTLKEKYNELFSSKYSYKAESFGINTMADDDCHFMGYVSSKDIYARFFCQAGDSGPGASQKIDKAYKQGDKLFIETTLIVEDQNYSVNYEFGLENGNYVFVSSNGSMK